MTQVWHQLRRAMAMPKPAWSTHGTVTRHSALAVAGVQDPEDLHLLFTEELYTLSEESDTYPNRYAAYERKNSGNKAGGLVPPWILRSGWTNLNCRVVHKQ